MLLVGILITLVGLFGVIWFAFLISRKLRDVYGAADTRTAQRAVRDDGMLPLRIAMRGSAAVALIGVVAIVVAVF